MRVLITGITGFVGSHFAEYLLNKNNIEVYGIMRWRSDTKNINHIKDKITIYEADLRDLVSIKSAIEKIKPDKIFHLGAQSFVGSSFNAPQETLTTNIIGQLNILETVKSLGINPFIQVAGCYSEDTCAVTRDGFKYWNAIKEGDLVLSVNPQTECVEYKKVQKVIRQHYKGKMIHFKSKSSDLLVTPNHMMLIKKNKGKRLKFVRADELTGRNYLPLGETKHTEEIKNNYNPELFYLVGIFIGDGYLVPTRKELQWSGFSHSEYISRNRDEEGKFTATVKPLTKIYESPRIFLAIPREDKSRNRVENVLKKLNIKYSAYENEIYFVPPEYLCDIFLQCNKGASNKKIPQWMFSAPKNLLIQLYNGLIDSDGNWRHRRQNFCTTSDALVPQFISLCRLIGKWVTFRERKYRKAYFKKQNRVIIGKPSYDFSITNGEKIITDGSSDRINKKEIDYDGMIWCVEVEENHNLLIERNGKVSFCGNSSEEYGLVYEKELPIKETNPLRPLSPYAISKVAQDMLGFQYFKSYGLNIVVTRAFNHTGVRRGEPFVTSNFAKQIASIEKGKQKPVIKVGNLEAIRDFTDVRDVVSAYWLALEKCKPGEVYNICSSKGYKIRKLLDILLSYSKMKVKIEQDPERMRPSDVPVLIGDCTKFKEATGWAPKIPFEETLQDLLNYWRANV